jgi:hypothetical protein
VSKGSDLGDLLESEREPVGLLLGESVLVLESDGSVKKRRRGRDDDSVLTKSGNGLLGGLERGGDVVLPHVSAGDQTEGEDKVRRLDGLERGLKLRGVSSLREVDVDGRDGEGLDEVERLAEGSEVGGEDDLGGDLGKLLVGGLELSGEGLSSVEDKDGLVDLNGLGTGLLELGEKLGVNGDELIEGLERLVAGSGVSGGFSEGEEGDGSEDDGSGGDTELLGLLELSEGLVVVKLEVDGTRDLGNDVVVVRVEPRSRETGSSQKHNRMFPRKRADETHHFFISIAWRSTPLVGSCRPRPIAKDQKRDSDMSFASKDAAGDQTRATYRTRCQEQKGCSWCIARE